MPHIETPMPWFVVIVLAIFTLTFFFLLLWVTRPVNVTKKLSKINDAIHTFDLRKGTIATTYKVEKMPLFEYMAKGQGYKTDTWFLCNECHQATIISYTDINDVNYCPCCGSIFMEKQPQ